MWAAVERCQEDNYGMAGKSFSKPFVPGVVDQLRCEFHYTDAVDIGKMTLNYYPSAEHFARHKGIDLVPERHDEFRSRAHKDKLRLRNWTGGDDMPWMTERPKMGLCRIPQDDGGEYIIQKIGPLVSVGNYDYWQIGWQDVWELSKTLLEHPDGIMFTESFTGAVDDNGKVLGFPPIHIHHIHVTPQPGVKYKQSFADCFQARNYSECAWGVNLAIEQHGDYQCLEGDGGTDCLLEKTGDGYAKVLKTPVDIEGEDNDVRAPNSTPMRWWHQAVIRWFPKRAFLQPLSQHFFVGPGRHDPADQRTDVWVFPVKTDVPQLYWYTGLMKIDGRMVRNKLHSHNTMFRNAFWFNARPEDLGLDDPKFQVGWDAWKPLSLDGVGLSAGAVTRLLLSKLEESSARYDIECPGGFGSCKRSRPHIVCESWVQNVKVGDPISGKRFSYDRRAPACCRPWNFSKGDAYTVVAFIAPLRSPLGPWSPNKIPSVANMHVHWLMTFSTPDDESHYAQTINSQRPDIEVTAGFRDLGMDTWMGLNNIYNWIAKGGVRNDTLRPPWFIRLLGMKHMCALYPVPSVCVLVVLMCFCCLWCRWCCRRCLTAKRAQDHPVVQCVKKVDCPCPGIETTVAKAVRYGKVVEHDE